MGQTIVLPVWVIILLTVTVSMACGWIIGRSLALVFRPRKHNWSPPFSSIGKQSAVEVSGPIFAWKLLDASAPWFISPVYRTVWLDGWNKTEIEPRGSSGFYCFNSIQGCWDYCTNERLLIVNVQLAGKVVEHERGYRAQMAKVVGIERTGSNPKWVELASEYFKVPVMG